MRLPHFPLDHIHIPGDGVSIPISHNFRGELLTKGTSMEAGPYSLEPHGGQLLELHPGVGRQVQDALPVLVAGVGGIGEVLRALQDGFQHRGEILL